MNYDKTEKQLLEGGWKFTGHYFADGEIWAKGNKRILWNREYKAVIFEYDKEKR